MLISSRDENARHVYIVGGRGETNLLTAVVSPRSELQILWGTILNRTYGTHEQTICFAIFTNNIWSYLLWPPVIAMRRSKKGEENN